MSHSPTAPAILCRNNLDLPINSVGHLSQYYSTRWNSRIPVVYHFFSLAVYRGSWRKYVVPVMAQHNGMHCTIAVYNVAACVVVL